MKFDSENSCVFLGKVVFERIECYQRKIYVLYGVRWLLLRHGKESCMVRMSQTC